MKFRLSLLTLFLVILTTTVALAQNDRLLGDVHFPNSGAEEAQEPFIRGLLFLHNFEYRDAAASFREAQAIDPDFAMAYWGEAMTKNQPIWFRQQRDEAVEILNRYASTPGERLRKIPTDRERGYLQALEILFGTVPETENLSKEERDFAYRDAMRDLHEAHPDDLEARSFYGLSMLGTAHEGRDFRLYMQAAAVLMPVWEANKKHPGAAHYLIHSFDDPIHAPLGLPMARAYAEIAPAAAHAQHMVSHIFVALGMWEETVVANENASRVEIAREEELGLSTTVCGHNLYWLTYGYVQQGRYTDAEEIINQCYERVQVDRSGRNVWHFAMMRARYIIDTGQWERVSEWTLDFETETSGSIGYFYTNALYHLQKGNMDAAALEASKLNGAESAYSQDHLAVMQTQLQGLIAIHRGQTSEGMRLLERAVEMELNLPLDYGPPAVLKPSLEMVASVHMQQQRWSEAAGLLHRQLELAPKRIQALQLLAETMEQIGETEEAQQLRRQIQEIQLPARATSGR
ncbi:MAG: hypothetical protein ACNA78_02105 [Balneolaceae bacterium]